MVSKQQITADAILAKSLISQTLQNARASLMNPKRPDTPEQSRHLFNSGEYAGNRPGSAYNVESLVSQALDDLNKDLSKRVQEPIAAGQSKRVKLKPKKFRPAQQVLEEVKKVGEVIEEAKEEEEDFEQTFEKQYEKMLEDEIGEVDQGETGTTGGKDDFAGLEEYKRAKEQLTQFLQKQAPAMMQKDDKKEEAGKDEGETDALEDQSDEYYARFRSDETRSKYEAAYDDLVDTFTLLSRHKDLDSEEKTIEKAAQLVKKLGREWGQQADPVATKCPRETMLKGVLYLMNTKHSGLLLELCVGGLIIVRSLYRTYKAATEKSPDFYYVFNSLLSIVKVLYKLSKESANDKLFRNSAAIDESLQVIDYFTSGTERLAFVSSASRLVETAKPGGKGTGPQKGAVVVKNENSAYELLLFMLGMYKNLSIAKENRGSMVDKGALTMMIRLLKGLIKAEDELKDKLPQCLVQITGTMRNLLGDTGGALGATLKDVLGMLRTYNGSHSELSLNCLRILSKASLNAEHAAEILRTDSCSFLVELLRESMDRPFVFVRIAFVLGNLTMLFGTACQRLYSEPKNFESIFKCMAFYLDIWKQRESGKDLDLKAKGVRNIEEFVKHFNTDVVVKAIRLCANLWISEDLAKREAARLTLPTFQPLGDLLALDFNNDKNEDLILNSLCCLSNMLFFVPSPPIAFSEFLLDRCKTIMAGCSNSEIRVECLRIFGNLSRSRDLLPTFASKSIVSGIYDIMTNLTASPRESFYAIGALINLAADEQTRATQMYGARLNILLQKLESGGFEDLEMTKNICKLLVNLCDSKTKSQWTNEQIEKVDHVLTPICDECDSSLEVANEAEKEVLNELHKVANNLINVLPETMHCCPMADCGRKFKTMGELDQHVLRRHGDKKSGDHNNVKAN